MIGMEPNLLSWLLLGYVTITTVVSYAPQAFKLLKTKSSDDISFLSWGVWVTQYACLTVYAVVFTTDIMLSILYVAELLFCTYILILALKYRTTGRRV
jgi:uncharacterized protein with PQ loop repeat